MVPPHTLTLVERIRQEERFKLEDKRGAGFDLRRKRSMSKADLEAEEVRERSARRIRASLRRKKMKEEEKRRTAKVAEASVPCSPARQLEKIRGMVLNY